MLQLNLPPFQTRTRKADGKEQIFDTYRRKFVALTPEEWVRQHFCHYLTDHLGYPSGRLVNEYLVEINGQPKRCDTVIFDKDAKPLVVVEYKASSVEITQNVFDQILRYDWVLKAPYLIVSNGLQHLCCHIDYTTQQAAFLQEIPPCTAAASY